MRWQREAKVQLVTDFGLIAWYIVIALVLVVEVVVSSILVVVKATQPTQLMADDGKLIITKMHRFSGPPLQNTSGWDNTRKVWNMINVGHLVIPDWLSKIGIISKGRICDHFLVLVHQTPWPFWFVWELESDITAFLHGWLKSVTNLSPNLSGWSLLVWSD